MSLGRRLLENVRDNVFSFDDPAFYWFCRHVRNQTEDGLPDLAEGGSPLPWKLLMERPRDYRGEPVVIEGVLRDRHAYELTNRPALGRLHQYELSEPGSRAVATVVAIEDCDQIPLRSLVRVTGYFIKVRAYETSAGDTGAGPLLVARRLALIAAPPAPTDVLANKPVMWWLMPGTALLSILWLILRRTIGHRGSRPRRPSGASAGTTPEASDDFDWLTKRD
jgi:hypothetical protein